MTATTTVDVWMIEVLSDGIGQRHRRYLAAAHNRDSAIAAVRHHVGSEVVVTSSTQLEGEPASVCQMQLGDVRGV
jgi:hypothetical protein